MVLSQSRGVQAAGPVARKRLAKSGQLLAR